jgi:hypothetical protein
MDKPTKTIKPTNSRRNSAFKENIFPSRPNSKTVIRDRMVLKPKAQSIHSQITSMLLRKRMKVNELSRLAELLNTYSAELDSIVLFLSNSKVLYLKDWLTSDFDHSAQSGSIKVMRALVRLLGRSISQDGYLKKLSTEFLLSHRFLYILHFIDCPLIMLLVLSEMIDALEIASRSDWVSLSKILTKTGLLDKLLISLSRKDILISLHQEQLEMLCRVFQLSSFTSEGMSILFKYLESVSYILYQSSKPHMPLETCRFPAAAVLLDMSAVEKKSNIFYESMKKKGTLQLVSEVLQYRWLSDREIELGVKVQELLLGVILNVANFTQSCEVYTYLINQCRLIKLLRRVLLECQQDWAVNAAVLALWRCLQFSLRSYSIQVIVSSQNLEELVGALRLSETGRSYQTEIICTLKKIRCLVQSPKHYRTAAAA